VPEGTDPVIANLIRRQFQQRVQVLERTLQAVRNVARSTRVAAARLSDAKRVETAERALTCVGLDVFAATALTNLRDAISNCAGRRDDVNRSCCRLACRIV
jgi:hypothetical protein